MSTIIQRILCNHQYKQINAITLVCEKCGKVKRIKCCHDWESFGVYYYGFSARGLLLKCKKCGKLIRSTKF